MKIFLARINWRQVLVHAVAFWFVSHAFETLYYLFDLKIVDAAKSSEMNMKEMLQEQGITIEELQMFLVCKSLSGSIGLLFAFFLSLLMSIRRKWFWLNSLLSLVLTILLFRAHVWYYTKYLFYYPGRLFSNSIIELLINGILLLAIGLLLFFSKPIIRLISGRPKAS